MTAEAGNPYFRVGYISLSAFATINHLHFQVPSARQLEITSLPISNTPSSNLWLFKIQTTSLILSLRK
ncbi:putative GDP-L-galactose phosphorylase 2 [Sesbania bispinosa]|nr:putative GDP-L-galactose phosphorylase 2 [Sesbania bispinosa]